MTVFTKTAVEIFAPTTSGGVPRAPSLDEVQTWGTEVERSVDLLGSGQRLILRAASTANVNIESMPATLDDVTLVVDDLILIKDEPAEADNGIYVFNGTGAAATRSTDYNTFLELAGTYVGVSEGTANENTLWVCMVEVDGNIGTDDVVFLQLPISSSPAAEAAAEDALAAAEAASADAAIVLAAIDFSSVNEIFATKADATADLANIPADAFVMVLVDESQSSARTVYQKQTGSLVLKATLGGGNVNGPASSTTNAVALFSDTGGKLIKNSSTTLDTDGAMAADSDTRLATQKATNTRVNAVMQGQPCFQANKNAVNQTAITAGTLTKITFTTEEFDTGGYYDSTNSKWVPPAGVVAVTAQVLWGTANVTDQAVRVIAIYKNGVQFKRADKTNSGTDSQSDMISCLVAVNGTDYLEVYALNGAAASGDKSIFGTVTRTYFCGHQVVRT